MRRFSAFCWAACSLFAACADFSVPGALHADQPDAALPVIAPAEGYEALVERLRACIVAEIDQKRLPAFSIALVDGERVVWAEGFGHVDAARKSPANARTIYRVGSISKLLTDIGVMQLVEQGKLSLDAPVAEYLPEFAPRSEVEQPITLRQLMSHRSGLVRETPVGSYFDPDEPSLRATVASLNETSLVYPPDTKTKYSNAAIAVVGEVLERQSGTAFAEQVESAVLKPLGMTNSSFTLTPAVKDELAAGWMWTYDGRRFEAPLFALGTAPAGNLYASVLDLSKLWLSVFNDGRGESGRVLEPETLQLMTTPQTDKHGAPQSFGIGFHVAELDGIRKIGHGGAVYGFATQFEALPEKKLGVTAVASLDCSNGVVERIADYALRLLLARQGGRALPEYEFTQPVPRERIAQLVGRYGCGDKRIELSAEGGRLFLRREDILLEVRAASAGELMIDDVLAPREAIGRLEDDALRMAGERWERLADERPEEPPARWQGLIGEYGWDHNTLFILEDRGRLFALIEWFYYYPLTEISESEFAFPDYGLYHGERLKFTREAGGQASKVVAASVEFRRRDVGTAEGETFRIRPVKPIDELRQAALLAAPPAERGDFLSSELVELTELDASIKLDIRYASENNFTGAAFYGQARAFLQRPAAEAVIRVHNRLKPQGYGLLVHDAYRPWHVTKMFWDATPEEFKQFVADPAKGSRHNRGCAVDLTLYDLETGEAVPMVAGYDEFSPRSFPNYPGGTSRQRWHRDLLRRAMQAEGFSVYEFEWWHFDFQDWARYRILNQTFEELTKD